ncbi:hypothetical protein B1A_05546, partial [mine drainage metagenome]
ELRDARSDRRDYLIGVLAAMSVSVAQDLRRGIAVEDLDFRKDHDTNRVFNRMSSNFPYAASSRRSQGAPVAKASRSPS